MGCQILAIHRNYWFLYRGLIARHFLITESCKCKLQIGIYGDTYRNYARHLLFLLRLKKVGLSLKN